MIYKHKDPETGKVTMYEVSYSQVLQKEQIELDNKKIKLDNKKVKLMYGGIKLMYGGIILLFIILLTLLWIVWKIDVSDLLSKLIEAILGG